MTTKISNWNIDEICKKEKARISVYGHIFKVEYHNWDNETEILNFIVSESILTGASLKSIVDKASSYNLMAISSYDNKINILFSRKFVNQ